MKSSASTFKPLKIKFSYKDFELFFGKNSFKKSCSKDISKKVILFLMFKKVLCNNHVCMEMIFLCVII
jgi:hypothetical protein